MDPLQQLLKALQEGNKDAVRGLADELFITSSGQANLLAMNEFERYAPCRIYAVERDSFGWLIGCIAYNDKKFYFG